MDMERYISILFIFALLLTACSKNDDPDTAGTETINNELTFDQQLQTFIGYGFSFSKAKLVSIVESPPPDITVSNDGTLANLILQTGNFKNSFHMAGEYPDAATARQEFDKLTSITFPDWKVWAFGIKANQIWIFRTSTEKYAKIRIISTLSEDRGTQDYAECTFEWVYQPDGSLTFPGK